ncbi:periplasmic thiol:disulfide interchange protein DsbA [Methylophaga lonarensis MPL]|uniref:Thiol:disulfide interchange protein n=1 Tax=Methylophaga lonarensis MPL TaxID=1286106 RepID=M7P107_9GAMM|nr:thiol:disulfide interchange protein DsbA/DsbL [Methylophaga lonarensis]EMR13162.1 periplasmic thiol:disulfide interchange protein DsbA [Methylophaga lonarensis MPL]
MKKIMKFMQTVMGAGLLAASVSLATAADYVEGTHYKKTPERLAKFSPGSTEVAVLFSYTCPFCFRLEPYLKQWEKALPEDVNLVHVPAIFRDSWLEMARVFYAAEATGDLATLHPKLFDAIQVDKRRLDTEKLLLDFVAEQGIDRDNFLKVMNSMPVRSKVRQALLVSQNSGVEGVPSIIVNGQYRTDAPMAGGLENMTSVVDYLISK